MTTHNLKDFQATLRVFKTLTQKQFIAIHKRICFELFRRVLEKTPVDKGFLRANWGLHIGEPQSRGKNKSKVGKAATLSREEIQHAQSVMAQLSGLPVGQMVWLTNDMPYANTVEFGLYPNPPKKGSRVRKGRRWFWVQRSSGGFSKQAPAGMVQVSVGEMMTYLHQLATDLNAPPADTTG